MDWGYVFVFLVALVLTFLVRLATRKITLITIITALCTTTVMNTFEYFVSGLGIPAIAGTFLYVGYIALFYSIGICAAIRLTEVIRERMSKAKS